MAAVSVLTAATTELDNIAKLHGLARHRIPLLSGFSAAESDDHLRCRIIRFLLDQVPDDDFRAYH